MWYVIVERRAAVGSRRRRRSTTPTPRIGGQNSLVGVEDDPFVCTRSRRGPRARIVCVGEHPQGFIGVRGHDHRVEVLAIPSGRHDGDAARASPTAADRVAAPHGAQGSDARSAARTPSNRRAGRATSAVDGRRSGRGCRGSAGGSPPGNPARPRPRSTTRPTRRHEEVLAERPVAALVQPVPERRERRPGAVEPDRASR